MNNSTTVITPNYVVACYDAGMQSGNYTSLIRAAEKFLDDNKPIWTNSLAQATQDADTFSTVEELCHSLKLAAMDIQRRGKHTNGLVDITHCFERLGLAKYGIEFVTKKKTRLNHDYALIASDLEIQTIVGVRSATYIGTGELQTRPNEHVQLIDTLYVAFAPRVSLPELRVPWIFLGQPDLPNFYEFALRDTPPTKEDWVKDGRWTRHRDRKRKEGLIWNGFEYDEYAGQLYAETHTTKPGMAFSFHTLIKGKTVLALGSKPMFDFSGARVSFDQPRLEEQVREALPRMAGMIKAIHGS